MALVPLPPRKSKAMGLPASKRKRPNSPGDFLSSLGRNSFTRPGEDTTRNTEYEPNKQVRDFQPYGVGKPKYGGGRSMPNVGPVTGKEGYRDRDLKNRAMKSRQMKLLKKRQAGNSKYNASQAGE